jgi:uncharacterized phiE125 gp8 family phage protein
MRSVVVIVPPAVPAVSLDEAKAQLRVDHGEDDALIAHLVAAATAALDGPDGWLGRALVRQTLELRCEAFPAGCNFIALPLPPLVAAGPIALTYADAAGSDRLLDAADYRVIGAGGRGQAYLALAYGKAWPAARRQPESVRLRFDAGYGAGAEVPAPIRHAILLMVGHLYEHRGEVAETAAALQLLPAGADALLAPYRIYAA